MATLVQHSPCALRKHLDIIPQHPLERLRPLRENYDRRRETFAQWPKPSIISPERLCNDGFYYMGMQDKVQCSFCGGVLSGFELGDDIEHEHARHFGKCELVQRKNSSNFARNVVQQQASANTDIVKLFNRKYSLYNDRLLTFAKWSPEYFLSPTDLAETGLYFTGVGDKCQCYACGGILSDWETGDVPKAEHDRWFPRCPLSRRCQ